MTEGLPWRNPFAAVRDLRVDLPDGAELPRWAPVRRRRQPAPPVDIAAQVEEGMTRVAASVPGGLAGKRVAVGAGSRGIADVAAVVAATVRSLRRLGADPVVVPAMGSHGSSEASGQAQVLADLGIDEQSVGAPVMATMGTVVVGTTAEGCPVHVDRVTAECDGVVVVNRVKPHTDFSGDFGSGLAKMSVIGLGNATGAAGVHSAGSAELPRRIRETVDVLRDAGILLAGVGIVEDAAATTAHVEVLPAAEIGREGERRLLDRAARLHGHLPFDDLDVLVVDAMGKDISGSGMDTNVLGRFWIPRVEEPDGPHVDVVTVHALTPASHGNASGIGLADLVPFRLLADVDLAASYVNALTSGTGGLRRSRTPMALPTDRDVIHAAVRMCAQPEPSRSRLVRIRSTLHTDHLMVSEPLLPEVHADPSLEVVGDLEDIAFSPEGDLAGWPSA